MRGMTRRALFRAGAVGAAAAAVPFGAAAAAPRRADASQAASYRAAYHFTVPDQWKNDPQRPVWIDGEYHYYYLYNADYLAGGHAGTAWRLATSTDLVSFRDQGIAVPKDTTPNGDVLVRVRGRGRPTTPRASGPARSSSLATQEPVRATPRRSTSGTPPTAAAPSPPRHRTGPAQPRGQGLPRPQGRAGRGARPLGDGCSRRTPRSASTTRPTSKSGHTPPASSRRASALLECPDLFRITG